MEIGRYQKLPVVRRTSSGAYLGSEADAVLLPRKLVPRGVVVGDELRVFVHHDSEGRRVATTRNVAATLGRIAVMEVVGLTPHGAFVDWGLDKDLFVPTVEQQRPMEMGSRHVVEVRLDERTDRLIGSSRLGRYFDPRIEHFTPGRQVELLVWGFNEAGIQVVVDGRHSGLVYESDALGDFRVGDQAVGYVDRLRDDGKLDISLKKRGRSAEIDAQEVILAALEDSSDGFLALHDKSPPDAITRQLDISKRVFKAAIGGLYKRSLIRLEADGIRLVRPG